MGVVYQGRRSALEPALDTAPDPLDFPLPLTREHLSDSLGNLQYLYAIGQ